MGKVSALLLLRGNRPLHHVLFALAIKLGLLAALYVLFFSPAHRPSADAQSTESAVIGTAVTPEPK